MNKIGFEELVDYFKKVDNKWETILAEIGFGYDNSMGCSSIITIQGDFKKIIPLRSTVVNPFLRTIFHKYLYEGKKRDFNKVIINITPTDYSVIYEMDEAKVIKQKYDNAKLFVHWIHDIIPNRIFDYEKEQNLLEYDEEFDCYKPSWDYGIFTFKIINNTVITNIELFLNKKQRNLDMQLSQEFIDVFLEHHKITHTILKNEWESWNKIVVKAPRVFIPMGKEKDYITYSLELENQIT